MLNCNPGLHMLKGSLSIYNMYGLRRYMLCIAGS